MSDLIDRQEVLKQLKDMYNAAHYWSKAYAESLIKTKAESYKTCLSEMALRVHNIPSLNQWIPCTERLPNYNIRVLVINKNNEIDIAELVDYSDINEPDEWWSYEYKVHDTVAWMPLPEPWKGEEE